ncbi:solute carrier family 22 member 7-like isoform X2 [Schistocerca gregaria]|uniref:solute carrier family 22 member 7-like isoform X2 n=1 Tax=Schistocerca gregaria TaxID=7010 RepID=UPI00211EBDC8|nr:solute carrier family 22 member 7-like isoform X2 [Schistocerca gregaria]
MSEDDKVVEEVEFQKSHIENTSFEEILEQIGSYGKFQIQLSIVFCCLTQFFSSMSSYGMLIALTVPEHWCQVPGREGTNSTIEMWKKVTIPRVEEVYSSCEMKVPNRTNETAPCMYGWEYDDTWFSATAASQEDWVCEREMYPNTIYSVSHFISIGFAVLLFYVGDRFGRRIQFLMSMGMMAVSRSLLTVSASVFPLYVALSAVAESPGLSSSESAIAIGIELTGIKHRSLVNFLAVAFYCLGTISIALAAWLLRNWIQFLLISSVPCFIPLLLHRYLPESPRWLLGKGRPEEALKVLESVAATNGKPLPCDTWMRLAYLSEQRTPRMDIRSIVTNRNLFKNTVLLVISRSAGSLVLYTLLFHNKSFGGNPFVAYVGQGVLMMVSCTLAHFIGNHLGRRFTHCLVLLISALVSFILVVLTTVSSEKWLIPIGSLMIQFFSSSSLLLTNLQGMEIHPTRLRQTSIAVEYLIVSCVMCANPYLSYLGNTAGQHYLFGILGIVMIFTSILMSFLPESLNEKLPETMKDAALYGCDQKFWSLPRSKPSLPETVTLYKPDI